MSSVVFAIPRPPGANPESTALTNTRSNAVYGVEVSVATSPLR